MNCLINNASSSKKVCFVLYTMYKLRLNTRFLNLIDFKTPKDSSFKIALLDKMEIPKLLITPCLIV